ncbi:MAG TPA: EAL domain-containing protein [Burkholderiales bacterium]|nr:EAL domain-containing protein [Burkholderiales bacterium]
MAELKTGEHIYAEQVRQLYRLSRPAYVGSLVNSSILVFALWGVVSTAQLGAWLCAMFVVAAARYLLYRAHLAANPPDDEARLWARRFVIGAGCAGLLWGIAGSLLYPVQSLPHQFLLIFLIGGMVMAGLVILAPVPAAFLAFMLPSMTLVTATVFAQGTMLHIFMGVMMLVYLAVQFGTLPIISGMMRDALRVKFENSGLVDQLSYANRELSQRIASQQRAEEVLRQSEQRYRYMFEANPLSMWIRDERTMEILAVNEAALKNYGYAREEFLRLKSIDMIAAEDTERFLEALRTRDPKGNFTNYWRHRRKDGSVIDVETVSHPFDLDARPARLTLVNDITERMRAERRLQMGHAVTRILADARTVEEALPQVLRVIGETSGWVYGARWALDKAANQLHCAETWCESDPRLKEFEAYNRLRTQTPGASTGPIHRVWTTSRTVWISDIGRDGGARRANEAMKAGLHSVFAFPILIGSEFFGVVEFFGRSAGPADSDLMQAAQIMGSQIGQFMARKAAEQNLRFVASHDPLTGLFNRSMFNERLQQALAQATRFERSLALLFIDLDGFKVVNDTIGHNGGDQLLSELASRLRSTLREGDVIGRMGGDEFVVLIEEFTEPVQVAEVAKKVLETVVRPFVLQGREFEVTASLGISIFPDDGQEAQTLLKNADIAMYLVKQQGKNSFRFYAPQMNVHLTERLSMESGLRRAMERSELTLLYQPKVGVRDGQMSGVEALVRWQHPTQGMIGPAEFMPVAEDAGLALAIGEWVLHTACRQILAWREEGLPLLRVAVNLSPRQFSQDSLIQVVREVLHQTAIDPARLELEITEEMVLRNPDRAVRLLGQIKDLGVRVVIDDFGTGYSSLNHLKRLPVDAVKIDRSLTLDLPRSTDAATLTRAVIAMAHSLNLAVIAEGVETRDQWEFLHQAGCEEMQGNYFSTPVPAEIAASIMRQPPQAGRRATVQSLRPLRADNGSDQ